MMLKRLGMRAFVAAHRFLYAASGGAIGGRQGNAPVLLLTTVGRKSGRRRTTPLLYLAEGGHYVIVASNGGSAQHPAWFFNLQRTPTAEVRVKRRRIAVTAEETVAEEKERLWPLITAMYPAYGGYQRRTPRDIPVVILRPSQIG